MLHCQSDHACFLCSLIAPEFCRLCPFLAGGLSGFKSNGTVDPATNGGRAIKGVLSTALTFTALTSLITLCWLTFGYSLALGDGCRGEDCAKLNADPDGRGWNLFGNAFLGGSEKFWLFNTATHDLWKISNYKNILPLSTKGTIPEALFIMFQLTIAIIT